METFGEYLRSQREKKGIRLEEIASITKIHIHSLQHLEKGTWSELPPEPFIRGFITAYAKYVGLEPKDVLERYALEHGKSSPQNFELGVVSTTPKATETSSSTPLAPPASKDLQTPDEILRTPRTLPIRKIVFAAGGLFILLSVGLLVSLGKRNTESVIATEKPVAPEVVAANPEAEAPKTEPERVLSSKQEVPAIPVPEAKPVPKEFPHEIVLETKERSWGKIVIDGKAPVEFYSAPGKPVTYQAKEKIKLVLGNSSGAKVAYNGDAVEGKRLMGTIRYYVYPNGSRFPQDIPKRKEASESAPSEGAATPPTENPPSN